MNITCESCGGTFLMQHGRGRTPRYCSSACRQRAYRERARARRPVFPERMTSVDRWTRADGKRPVMPSGAPASSTDPSTWSSFSEVQQGAGDGFGFMLGGGIGCIDLDDCLSPGGELAPWARAEIARWQGRVLFMERSMSGSGVHVFVEADERPGQVVGVSGGGRVERYFYGRFIRTTGDEVKLDRILLGDSQR